MSVVGQGALVGSFPGDGGFGAPTHFTPEGDTLSVVARHVTQGQQELWGDWRTGVRGQRISRYEQLPCQCKCLGNVDRWLFTHVYLYLIFFVFLDFLLVKQPWV